MTMLDSPSALSKLINAEIMDTRALADRCKYTWTNTYT